MEDGIVFFYTKDNILYPVAMDDQDFRICRHLVNQVFTKDNKLVVLTNRPMGELENMREKK
ncbi:MAG: hypothetical protein E3J23_08555 [Candidatus Stahlbacteria bacterium]|nr:MAG: hypothetical protein E3J23_08555 [Candidatus Stahlbacteria bacterium]